MPLHECFHVPVTSCQRAEVKRVLHCDATARADMDALLLKSFWLPKHFHPNNYKFHILIILCLYSLRNAVLNLSVTTEVYKFDARISSRSIRCPSSQSSRLSASFVRSGRELFFDISVRIWEQSFLNPSSRA